VLFDTDVALLIASGNRWTRLLGAALIAIAIGVGAAGCLGLDVASTFRWPLTKSEQPQPTRMTVAWTTDMQKKNGKNVLRGFQGKVQFFAADLPKPDQDKSDKDKEDKKPDLNSKSIPVDGTLTVYAFEETPGGKEGSGPSKKYVFPTKDLKKVHREGPQGPEYAIWLAWDKAGGPERHIRLLARFDPPGGGQPVMSENSREILPGIKVQYAAGVSPEARKTMHDSTGHPVSEADLQTEPPPQADSTSPASASTATSKSNPPTAPELR
jgi:hypothetical protein